MFYFIQIFLAVFTQKKCKIFLLSLN